MKNRKLINIKADGPHSNDVQIALDSGESLGLIQSMEVSGQVGGLTKLKLESILNQAEIQVLQKDTEVTVINGGDAQPYKDLLREFIDAAHEFNNCRPDADFPRWFSALGVY